MPMEPHCQFTAKDFSILETMLERCRERDGRLAALLRRKLKAATVVFRDDIPANVVTLNSRVVYRAGNEALGPHVIVQSEGQDFSDYALSIHTPRGLGLLGLAEGQSITIDLGKDGSETLTVEKLVFQPEADLRQRDRQVTKPIQLAADNSGSQSTVVSFRQRPAPAIIDDPDNDDPGPRAA